MEKVGVLVVSYGSRETAIVDALSRTTNYKLEIYVADKQANPFNMQKATEHVVIPDLDPQKILKFAQAHRNRIDFGIVGPEKPIVEGIRDLIEEKTRIPIICPTKQYAIERSKVQQRLLLEQIAPETNPRFKIFTPEDCTDPAETRKKVYAWLDELDNKAVVKPDTPAAGKGVGVWGDHFTTRQQLYEHFQSNLQHGTVIIEEKVDGEESSFQAFSDGKHLIPLPDTRDYKRAFNDDKGPNTGGMGSYKDADDTLPFLTKADRERELEIVNRIFNKWRGKNETALRGVPMYVAFMHTGSQPKILEINSRPGDPEIINILPIIKDDFVDLCQRMVEGNLTRVETEKAATVVTYKAPPSYAGYAETFPDRVDKTQIGTPVELAEAYALEKRFGNRIRIYPASIEQRGNKTYALKSRAVAVVGIADTIEEARRISLEGTNAIRGGALWNRTDIASRSHIRKTAEHLTELRSKR